MILARILITDRDRRHGLAFSRSSRHCHSSVIIEYYKELENTIPGFTRPNHGYLESWARQGVLLPNTVLTVRAGQAHSHPSPRLGDVY
ncbi:uracil-DNA glycosylase [Escherichia coli]|uniref:Uracil-DNA glycosylase n=1 Tax=Escherichia coli TaxID=562 RepID=A0A376U473_ECOLX|nr:uracil-DNA glycosylase [Escherichia coli]